MAAPTIISRPSKEISGYTCEWVACGGNLPVEYQIQNTKFPANSEDSSDSVTAVADNGGNAQLTIASHTYSAGDYLKLSGFTENYNGVFLVLSDDGANELTIDTAFIANDSGDAIKYYKNYKTEVRVYAGVDGSHPYSTGYELIGTIQQIPGGDNITKINVAQYVKVLLNSIYDDTQPSFPNDLNAWKNFYIDFRETYTGSSTSFTSDSSNFLYALYATRQFGNLYGGVMYNYVHSVDTYAPEAQFLTTFERVYFAEETQEVSIISDSGIFDLVVKVYVNGSLDDTITTSYTGGGAGVYRLSLVGLNVAGADSLEVYIERSGIQSETLIFDVELCTINQEPSSNWILADGTWDDGGEWIDTDFWND